MSSAGGVDALGDIESQNGAVVATAREFVKPKKIKAKDQLILFAYAGIESDLTTDKNGAVITFGDYKGTVDAKEGAMVFALGNVESDIKALKDVAVQSNRFTGTIDAGGKALLDAYSHVSGSITGVDAVEVNVRGNLNAPVVSSAGTVKISSLGLVQQAVTGHGNAGLGRETGEARQSGRACLDGHAHTASGSPP